MNARLAHTSRRLASISSWEWLLALRVLAVAGAFLATAHDERVHALAWANIGALFILCGRDWARGCRERLGDLLPAVYAEMRAAAEDRLAPAVDERTLCAEIDAALGRAPAYSRHVGVVHLRWMAPEAATSRDLARLQTTLRACARGGEIFCFLDNRQALALVDGVRGYDELAAARDRIAEAFAANPAFALVSQGLAMSPLHGYSAEDLIAAAKEDPDGRTRFKVIVSVDPLEPAPEDLAWAVARMAS